MRARALELVKSKLSASPIPPCYATRSGGWLAKRAGWGIAFLDEIDRDLEGVLTLIDEALRSPHPAAIATLGGHLPLRGPRRGGMNTAIQPAKITVQRCYSVQAGKFLVN